MKGYRTVCLDRDREYLAVSPDACKTEQFSHVVRVEITFGGGFCQGTGHAQD